MTQTALGGGFYHPDPAGIPTSNAALVIDATGEKVAFIFQAPKTGNLWKVRFRTSTVATGDVLKVSFQNVDATTGDPDGTPDQYRLITVANGDDNVWLTTGIVSSDGTDTGSLRAVTRGEWLAIVIEFNSYVAGNIQILSSGVSLLPNNGGYADHYTSSWSKQSTIGCATALYDDGSIAYTPTLSPGVNASTSSFASNTTPDEYALKFSLPVPFTVGGAFAAVDLDGNADLVLYDSDGSSVLASASFDSDQRQGTGVNNMTALFSSEIALLANTYYYLAVKPTTTTGVTGRYSDVSAAADFDAFPGGQTMYWSQRTDAGAWADTTTRRPRISLLITKVGNDAGGGGGMRLAGHGGLAA